MFIHRCIIALNKPLILQVNFAIFTIGCQSIKKPTKYADWGTIDPPPGKAPDIVGW